jgi:hypothetical protein
MARQVQAAVDGIPARPGADDAREDVLQALLLAGRGASGNRATGCALVAYWHWLRHSTLDERTHLLAHLREAVEAGRTGQGAWVAMVLGEHDFELTRTATRAFLGERPMSLARHEAASDAARDWVRRSLALNRAAVFAALVERADEADLERLCALRGTLARAESVAVIDACRSSARAELQHFLSEWRETLV